MSKNNKCTTDQRQKYPWMKPTEFTDEESRNVYNGLSRVGMCGPDGVVEDNRILPYIFRRLKYFFKAAHKSYFIGDMPDNSFVDNDLEREKLRKRRLGNYVSRPAGSMSDTRRLEYLKELYPEVVGEVCKIFNDGLDSK